MTQEPRPTIDLLPCPFCGAIGVLNVDSYMSCAWVDCQVCDSEGKTICAEDTNDANQMRAEAVAEWNRLTAHTLTPEQVERARMLLNMGTEQSWSLRCRAAFKLLREVVGDE